MGFMYCYGPSIGIIRSIDINDIKELACGSMVRNDILPRKTDLVKRTGKENTREAKGLESIAMIWTQALLFWHR